MKHKHSAKRMFLRKKRNRLAIRRASGDRFRLSVFRSASNIYAQVIDDKRGHTVVSGSSLDRELRGKSYGGNKQTASVVGEAVALRAIKAGIKEVVFDRGGYAYHGRIEALAEAARKGGLKF